MGFLILRIEHKGSETKKEREREPSVETIAVRHALQDPDIVRIKLVGADHGWEVASILYGRREGGWPFTAVVYTSRNREGKGRTGSTIHRLPCRRLAPVSTSDDENAIVGSRTENAP